MPKVTIIKADLANLSHRNAVVGMIDAYASDAMGGGRPLLADARERLGSALQSHPMAHVFLAYDGIDPVGVAVCFLGFSTFAARPLLNLHDLAVLPTHRRRGVGHALLEQVASAARSLGCCKVTLEVRADNAPAQALYQSVGFAGDTRFLEKPL